MSLWPYIAQVLEGEPCILVTVVRADGSTPRELGARMVAARTGVKGSVGGGALEHRAIKEALVALKASRAGWWRSDFPLGPNLGQCCGGYVSLLFEPFDNTRRAEALKWAELEARGAFHTRGEVGADVIQRTRIDEPSGEGIDYAGLKNGGLLFERFGVDPTDLYLFGAGHVAKALLLALAPLPFRVTLIDQRADMFPRLTAVSVTCRHLAEPVGAVAEAPDGAQILVMTHDHALDLEIILAALRQDRFSYVGVIGSKTKKRRFLRQLREARLAEHAIAALTCPVGIAGISAKAPAEIAVAIAAQLLMERHRFMDTRRKVATRLFSQTLSKAECLRLFGGLYEGSPWAVEAVWPAILSGEVASFDQFQDALRRAVDDAAPDRQSALIMSHPDLAGKLAMEGRLTQSSAQEQSGAGLDRLKPDEFDRFQTQNAAYRLKFGFPFIIAVKDLDAARILAAFEHRSQKDPESERAAALLEIHKIAGHRLASVERTIFRL